MSITVIFPNTPSASSLAPAEVDKRVSSFNQRRTQLKSNPSLYVSRTRLSVRRIPPFVTERGLRRLARCAVRTFEEEAKEQKRDALTPDELREPELPDDEDIPKKVKKKLVNEFIKQAKLVRQHDRVDAITGKNRSSGYGFLEMGKHADALRVLRWANNNPTVMGLLREWWKAELAELIELLQKELKSLGKAGGDAEATRDEKEARLKRMKAEKERLDELEDGKKTDDRTLIIEFAIENVQVVRRREAKRVEHAEVRSSLLMCFLFPLTANRENPSPGLNALHEMAPRVPHAGAGETKFLMKTKMKKNRTHRNDEDHLLRSSQSALKRQKLYGSTQILAHESKGLRYPKDSLSRIQLKDRSLAT